MLPDGTGAEVGALGVVYLMLVGLFLPYATWKSGRVAKERPAPRRVAYFVSALQTAAVLGGLGLGVAYGEGIELFRMVAPSLRDVGLGLVAVVALLGLLAPYRAGIARRRERRMQLFCQPTPGERALWVLVSLSAGFWEELVYRGVLTTTLARLTESPALAVALALAAFAGGHLHRGFGAVLPVALVGLVLHAFVLLTGALYVAMGVHFLYDVGAGFAYVRLAERHGIARETPGAPRA